MTKFHVGVVLTGFVVVTMLLLGPFGIGFTTTTSMEPVISPGDAFVTIENQPVERGDIIVYRIDSVGDSVVHKVVEVTDDGYVTKGVNNQKTDQSMGIPLVTPTDVQSVVLVFGGVPVHFPVIGWLLDVSVGFGYWLISAGLVFAALYFPGVTNIVRGVRNGDVSMVVQETVETDVSVSKQGVFLWVGVTIIVMFVTGVVVL